MEMKLSENAAFKRRVCKMFDCYALSACTALTNEVIDLIKEFEDE